jgi:hypothetical protein
MLKQVRITPAGGGQAGAILRMGIHAYAMGEGRIRREPQRGGREDVSTVVSAEMGTSGGLPQVRASGFHGSVQTPPGPVPGIVSRRFKDEISKTDADSPRNAPGV